MASSTAGSGITTWAGASAKSGLSLPAYLHRPRRALQQAPPAGRPVAPAPGVNVRVLRRDRLGGLIHEYSQDYLANPVPKWWKLLAEQRRVELAGQPGQAAIAGCRSTGPAISGRCCACSTSSSLRGTAETST